MTQPDTYQLEKLCSIIRTIKNAQIALENICDYVYTVDASVQYLPLTASDAEDIHLEAAGMLVPLETAIASLKQITNTSKRKSNDCLDLATKTVAE